MERGRFDSSYGDLREYKGNGDDISNGEFSKQKAKGIDI